MKRFLTVLLTSSMIVGLMSPAGSGVMTEIKANTRAALSNLGAAEGRTERAAEVAKNFDQSIRDLYDNSMSATDEEIIASAEMMNSDFSAAASVLGEDADDLIGCLKYYEAAKSRYIAGSEEDSKGFSADVISEWDRQGEYTSYVMPADDMIRTLVPRIKVNACTVKDNSVDLDIYEWMTVGYASDDISAVNAAAYGYNFSLKLDCDRRGNWMIASVEDTDQNFDWMQEEVEYSLQAENESADALRVILENGEQEMMAASAAGAYNYNVASAIAYADKYCINYNSSYNSYKGRGGDCANFVSQCLFAGGFPQDSTWYKHSVAWINVMKQIAHFKQYGSFMNANNGNLLAGNPIYFDWNGDSTYDHATICVGRNNSGTAILDSHTKDLYHAAWNNWSFSKAATIQLHKSGSSSSTSSEGIWKKNSVGWWYEYADGSYLKSCWKKINNVWYYFNAKGYALTGLQKIGSHYFYFDPVSCAMKTGWVKTGGKWYYFKPEDCTMVTGFYTIKNKKHYFSVDGAEQFGWIQVGGGKYHLDEYGVVQYGWQTISGQKYFFDTNGIMVVGIVSIDGVIYDFDANGHYIGKSAATSAPIVVDTVNKTTTITDSAAISKGWYLEDGKWFFYSNGKPVTGWLDYKGDKYYLAENGVMVTGWKKIGSSWYYFESEGTMKTGWLKLGTKWYFLQQNGVMKTGWLKNGSWYYLDESGAMLAGKWLKYGGCWYYLGSNGAMKTGWIRVNGTWYYMNSDGSMKTGWLKQGDTWYYLKNTGEMATGQQWIDGRTYYFNSQGALQ